MRRRLYREILRQLDDQAKCLHFPAFGAGLYYVDARMSVHADRTHWGIVIQTIEITPENVGHQRIMNIIYRFGNHLHKPLGLKENRYLLFTSDGDDGPVFGEYTYLESDCLNPKVRTMRIRGHIVPVPHDPKIYRAKGIELLNEHKICPEELLRALTPEYRQYFFSPQDEVQAEFVSPIPLLLELDEWRHPRIIEDGLVERPSTCETFQLVAKVIATCDPEQYRPTEKPNTHWKNWLIADIYL